MCVVGYNGLIIDGRGLLSKELNLNRKGGSKNAVY
jgi:hypothetical protein